MKKLASIFLLIIISLGLTGCIVKKEKPTLTDENSRVVKDEKNIFSLRLPNEAELIVEREESSARLFQINIDSQDPKTKMRIEEASVGLNRSIDLFTNLDAIKELSRDNFDTPFYKGKVVLVEFVGAPGSSVPFYFLDTPSEHTYVFSFFEARPYEQIEEIINSFELIN